MFVGYFPTEVNVQKCAAASIGVDIPLPLSLVPGFPSCRIFEEMHMIFFRKVAKFIAEQLRLREEDMTRCGIKTVRIERYGFTVSVQECIEIDFVIDEQWLNTFCDVEFLAITEIRGDVRNKKFALTILESFPIVFLAIVPQVLWLFHNLLQNAEEISHEDIEALYFEKSDEQIIKEHNDQRQYENSWNAALSECSRDLYRLLDERLFTYPFVERLRASLRYRESEDRWLAYEDTSWKRIYQNAFRTHFPLIPAYLQPFARPFHIAFSLFHRRLTLEYEPFRLWIREYPHIQGESIEEIMTMLYTELRLN